MEASAGLHGDCFIFAGMGAFNVGDCRPGPAGFVGADFIQAGARWISGRSFYLSEVPHDVRGGGYGGA